MLPPTLRDLLKSDNEEEEEECNHDSFNEDTLTVSKGLITLAF
jgi:hypothetical protein